MIQTLQQFLLSLKGFGLILFVLFLILYLIRFAYLFFVTGRIIFKKNKKENQQNWSPLSLLLTVRNEEEMLNKNLPKLLTIDGADYEVIVVDDFSQDSTYLVLGSLKKQYRRLKISSLNEETRFSLKLSQNIALKAASYEWVLPLPVSIIDPKTEWLSAFHKEINDTKQVIAGYATIEANKGFINRIYRTGNYWLFMKSAGYINIGLPLVYSDENIAFRKQKYFETGGYGTKIKEPFANLELIINQFIQKKSASILFTPESVVKKSQQVYWKDFLELLKKGFRIEKHLSTTKQLFLRFDDYTRVLYLLSSILVIIFLPDTWLVFLSLFGIKTAAYLLIIKISQKRLREPKIFISSLVYGIVIPFFTVFYKWYFNYRSRKNRWRSTA
jgi:glycosyltransferase involved in cell wall biosynthesis